jgi:hypothetical protein
VWNSGADGVYTFNLFEHFEPKDGIWNELGSREKLTKLDQDYFASIRGGQKPVRQNWLPFAKYQKVPNLTPMHPKQVTPLQPAREMFEMGNDASTANTSTATLRLQFKDLGKPENVSVTLNGQTLTSPRQAESWLEFTLQPGQLKQGTNEVQVSLAKGQDQLSWTDLHCTLRWPSK